MKKTVAILIGNTDDGLNQPTWAEFTKQLRKEIDHFGDVVHFFGFSNPNEPWQNCCAVVEVDTARLKAAAGWDSFDEFVEDGLMPSMRELAKMYAQDSIAVLVGNTLFAKGDLA